jgi:hypothetical protein
MASAAAGSGLLIAAAGAAPAYAAAPAAPPASRTMTITAHPAAGGIGPHVILPCAVKPGVTPASCGQQTITCFIEIEGPLLVNRTIIADAHVNCTSPVSGIGLEEDLVIRGHNNLVDRDGPPNSDSAVTGITAGCEPGWYTNTATALITFPPGYVLAGGSNPLHQTSSEVPFFQSDCDGVVAGGGGGGGGCAVTSPSFVAHPAARRPHIIACP